jgi:RNA polymerase sigma-70 factor, ECF subfamily
VNEEKDRDPAEVERLSRALVERLRRGDHAALRPLFELHFDAIVRFVMSFLRLSGEERAHEICQITWIKVAKRLSDPELEIRTFRGWILSVAKYACLDDLRAAKARNAPLRTLKNAAELPDPRAVEPERLDVPVLMAAVEKALELLPEEQKEAFVLHWREGLTYEEIALRTGVPLATVKQRGLAAARKLRDLLGRYAD